MRIISWGGIGDALLTTPALRTIKQNDPNVRLLVYYSKPSHKDVFVNNVYIDELRKLSLSSPFDVALYYLRPGHFVQTAYAALRPSRYYRISASEIIGEMLDIKVTNKKVDIFLTDRECDQARTYLKQFSERIVIVQGTSGSSENKNWRSSQWTELVQSMPEMTFIQIGAQTDPPIKGTINLLGTNLRDSFAIIKYADAFVGPDSCFAHAANAFDTPGVVLFGPTSPHIWGHNTNINLYLKLPCGPCIDTLWDENCPYNKPCMDIAVTRVKAALETQCKQIKCSEKTINHDKA